MGAELKSPPMHSEIRIGWMSAVVISTKGLIGGSMTLEHMEAGLVDEADIEEERRGESLRRDSRSVP
jgi:hypothetical protein